MVPPEPQNINVFVEINIHEGSSLFPDVKPNCNISPTTAILNYFFKTAKSDWGDFKRLERRLYVRSWRRRALQLTLCSVKDCHFQPLPNTKHINWYFYLQLSDATIDVCLHSVHTSLCLWLCLGGEVVAVGKDTRVLRRQAHVSRPPLTPQPPFSAGARSRIRLLPSLLLLLYARLRCTVSV